MKNPCNGAQCGVCTIWPNLTKCQRSTTLLFNISMKIVSTEIWFSHLLIGPRCHKNLHLQKIKINAEKKLINRNSAAELWSQFWWQNLEYCYKIKCNKIQQQINNEISIVWKLLVRLGNPLLEVNWLTRLWLALHDKNGRLFYIFTALKRHSLL